MTDYSNRLLSSDLDAFRSDGTVNALSLTFSGTVAASGSQTQTSGTFVLSNLDFYQVLFDNSVKHSGRYRDFLLETATMVKDNTSSTEFTAYLFATLSGNNLSFTGIIPNFTGSALSLQSTTVNFRLVGYDSTLL